MAIITPQLQENNPTKKNMLLNLHFLADKASSISPWILHLRRKVAWHS